ncbi:MAG: neutral zinc metallopeptidase [Isosphaeraceae bacterium]
MRTEGQRESENIEDRRGMSGPAMATGGIGIVGVLIVVVYSLLGGDPRDVLDVVQPPGPGAGQQAPGEPYEETAEEAEVRKRVAVVLADTEDVWTEVFRQAGKRYEQPTLVLYRGATETECGEGQSAMGPFYCPADAKVYLDLGFFEELTEKFGAPGDFAQAYVVAHEVGHHVQNLLGISNKVHRLQQAAGSKAEANDLSVRLELQADFLAGVWANRANKMRDMLEQGDIEAAMNCAKAIGDDRLQKRSTGRIVPDAFTHGSSAQRVRWFKKGLQTGDINQGDTFNAEDL